MCGNYDFDLATEITTVTIITLEQRAGEVTTHPIVAPYSEAARLITAQQANAGSRSGVNLTVQPS